MGQNPHREPSVSNQGQAPAQAQASAQPPGGGAPNRQSNVRPLQPPPDFSILDERRSFRAHVDDGSKINGKLSFEGSARIDGQIEGDLVAKDAVWVGESAVILAKIRGASVVIEGMVTGDIIASQRIELRATARVLGNLIAPALLIHEGALFEGHCCMKQEPRREEHRDDRPATEERVIAEDPKKDERKPALETAPQPTRPPFSASSPVASSTRGEKPVIEPFAASRPPAVPIQPEGQAAASLAPSAMAPQFPPYSSGRDRGPLPIEVMGGTAAPSLREEFPDAPPLPDMPASLTKRSG